MQQQPSIFHQNKENIQYSLQKIHRSVLNIIHKIKFELFNLPNLSQTPGLYEG